MTIYEFVKEHYQLPVELYPYQIETVEALAPLERAGYYLDVGCVDAETEFLSPAGWVRMDQYDGHSQVAQYHLDGTIAFVKPAAYVKKPCETMIRLKTKYGVDQMLSPEHRVLYKSPVSDHLHVISAEELVARHRAAAQGFRGKFITTFTPVDRPGYALSDAELRVQVAVIADGYFPSRTTRRVVINLKKPRKKERLEQLLQAAQLPFTKHDRKTAPGYTYYVFQAPERTKVFDHHFYACTQAQLAILAEEVMHWDGCLGSGEFSTTVKASADFVQYALAATGQQATLKTHVRDRSPAGRGAGLEYSVHPYKGSPFSCLNASAKTAQGNVQVVPSPDGYKYCFMVPSTFLILRRNGRIFATGNTGKTLTSIVSSLYKLQTHQVRQVICLMPPILITNWSRNLARIPGVTHVCYRGTPKQRMHLDLSADFILMSYQIFKRDWTHLLSRTGAGPVAILCDEAQALKNIASDNHKKVRDFALGGNHLLLLTGTPLSMPIDGYAYIKLIAPTIYRNLLQFEQIHVEEYDFFKKPIKWRNLDLLAENLKVNAVRLLKEDVLKDLPPVTYTELYYDLTPEHLRLYREIAESQLKVFDDGTKLDLTHISALFNAMEQLPANAEHFSGGELTSTAYELLDEIMDELGEGKLVVFTKYRMTNRRLLETGQKYGVRALFSEVPPAEQQKNLDAFIHDPTCRLLVLQFQSGGAGIDGLQGVCNDVLFLELPPNAAFFTQAVARVHRTGQRNPVNVRIALAEQTIQLYRWQVVQDRDALINQCIRGPQDLRDAVLGSLKNPSPSTASALCSNPPAALNY